MRNRSRELFLLFLILFIKNCAPVGLTQTPCVLDKGKNEIKAGISSLVYIPFEYFFSYKRGIGLNTDIGVKLFDLIAYKFDNILYHFFGLGFELKHQIKNKEPYISLLLGTSTGYGKVGKEYFAIGKQKLFVLNFSSSLIMGNKNIYFALRFENWNHYTKDKPYNFSWQRDTFLLCGLSLGYKFLVNKKTDAYLEMSIFKELKNFPKGDFLVFPAIAYSYKF